MAEAIVDHVWLGRELRLAAVAYELRDRKAALCNVGVKRAVGDRSFGRHQVHAAPCFHAFAQITKLGDLGRADAEVAFCLEVDTAGMRDVKRGELRRDLAPNALLL